MKNNEMTQLQMIQETHDAVIEIKAKLPYMARATEDNRKDIDKLDDSHGKLKRNFWLLVGILAGSGVITGSVVSVLCS